MDVLKELLERCLSLGRALEHQLHPLSRKGIGNGALVVRSLCQRVHISFQRDWNPVIDGLSDAGACQSLRRTKVAGESGKQNHHKPQLRATKQSAYHRSSRKCVVEGWVLHVALPEKSTFTERSSSQNPPS